MLQRLAAALLAVSAFVYATEHRSHASERTGVMRAATAAAAGPLVPQLDVAMGPTVAFTLRVTNIGAKTTEIRFPDGQTHDFAVLDANGRTVWRWSEGRLFTQALRTQAVEKGATVEYAESWTPALPKGQYTVVATLHSDTHPLAAQQVIALR